MGNFLKIKTLIPLLIFFLFSVSQSYSQNNVSFSKLKERDNKLYLGEQVFSGLVVKTFITNQPKSITEIKDGIIIGKVIEFIEDLSFVSYVYRDTAIINNINSQILFKKQELEKAIQDTVKTSKKQYDFLNYEIGGSEKLLKLKEKDTEGKLNKNKKEIYDKYEQYIQANQQTIRKFQDIQLQINNLNQQIKSENDKPNYIPKKSMEYDLLNNLKEGKAIIYDSLGNKFGEGEFLNDKQNGLWTYYYPSQSKLAQGNFISGDGGYKGKSGVPKNGREGRWVFYHKNGKISEDAIYKNGKLNGIRKLYFENGSIKEDGSYLDGKLNGIRKLYFENGSIKEDGSYLDGKLNGNYTFYYENGRIKEDLFYKDEKEDGLRKLYFSNGNLKESGTFINGQASGRFVFYNENGSIWSEVDYKEGQTNGLEVVYNEEGKKKAEYYVKNDVKHGNEKIYFTNGKLKEDRNWKMGKEHGNIKIYYESGVLQSEAQFVNGKAHGDFITYYENGKTHIKAKFDTTSLADKNLIGDFYEYNEDGSLEAHGFANRSGQMDDKTPKIENKISKGELNKPYKCKCCKATINGLKEGVDKDGNVYNDYLKQLYEESKIFTLLGYQNVYEYMRVDSYKYCTMKCARTCYE